MMMLWVRMAAAVLALNRKNLGGFGGTQITAFFIHHWFVVMILA